MSTVYLTEKKKIKIVKDCKQSIYLKWENDYGAFDYWNFNGNIVQEPSVNTVQMFDKNIDDLKDVTDNFEVVQKQYNETYTCYATFPKQNTEGMQQLIRSRNIYRWDGINWLRVDVVLISFQSEKDKPYGKIKLRVTPNRIYIK